MERGTLVLDDVDVVVLDEADEMISMGFKEDLETIMGSADPTCSKWLFSATMSREVRKVAEEYLREPQQAQVNRTEMLPDTIEQIYYVTQESNKPEVLCKLIDAAEDFYGLVFCQTKSLVIDLTQFLGSRKYRVDCLHGDMDQNARERTMKAFRERRINLLICTDVASRGLDVKDVTHVINYSIPRELDSYVHRIGRTGRSGKTGFAFSLVTPSHRGLVGKIEHLTKRKMKEGKIPTRKEIGARKLSQVLATFQGQPAESYSRALELMPLEWAGVLAGMETEEVAARFLTMFYPEIFSTEKKAETPLLEKTDSARGGHAHRQDRHGEKRRDRHPEKRRSFHHDEGAPKKRYRERNNERHHQDEERSNYGVHRPFNKKRQVRH
jgi:ATP-dependent RNA helicase DeaD